MNTMGKDSLQLSSLYVTLRFLRNPRKLKIFETLMSKKRITTFDIAVLVGDNLSYVCDRLREFETVGLATRNGESDPFTKEAQTHVPSRSSEKYTCYEATDHAELIQRFITAFHSEKPLTNLPNLIKPEDIVKDCVQLERSEFLKVLEKFKVMHNLGALLVSLYYASPDHTADCNVLSSFLNDRLNPEEIHDILNPFSGNDYLVIPRYAPLKTVDILKQHIAELLRGWAMTRWLRRNRTTYSLTTEGEHIAKRLISEFRPQDLGINERKLRNDGVYEYKDLKKTVLSDLFALLIVIFLGLPIVVIVWIIGIAVFTWNLIRDICKGRHIKTVRVPIKRKIDKTTDL